MDIVYNQAFGHSVGDASIVIGRLFPTERLEGDLPLIAFGSFQSAWITNNRFSRGGLGMSRGVIGLAALILLVSIAEVKGLPWTIVSFRQACMNHRRASAIVGPGGEILWRIA
ncbi:MAG: hypothetical protein JW888_18090, partial [Pirellulales bacterium]|nr:hypothetical protein [Pirellulales bacterium]